MGGLREDGLPIPIDGTQLYLAAILDELRGTRADRVPPASEDELIDVREPETAAPVDNFPDKAEVLATVAELATPTEAAAAALEDLGISVPEPPAVKKTARKLRSRKPTKRAAK